MNGHIPFLDLVGPHVACEQEFVAVFREALRTGRFIGGPMVEAFEEDFARFCGSRYCIGVGSGTDALRFALQAAGVNRDDMVITVPNTFIATTEAISQIGAMPYFVDIEDRTYNMDAEKLQEFLETHCFIDDKSGRPLHRETRRLVSALVPVHLYGQIADMDQLMELAARYNLIVVEDACQAHGAEYFSRRESRWRRAGTMGTAGAFSFYPGKNLGACGEGGAVITDGEGIARIVRMLRDHGQIQKYHHRIEGYNGRLDAIQAGILRIKLRRLPEWNDERRRIAARYNALINGVDGIITPYEPDWSRSVYHLYVIRSSDRDEMRAYLSQRGIDTGLHYPIPLHCQEPYVHLGHKVGDLPRAERAAQEILSLPMYPGLTAEQQQRVVGSIHEHVLPVVSEVGRCV